MIGKHTYGRVESWHSDKREPCSFYGTKIRPSVGFGTVRNSFSLTVFPNLLDQSHFLSQPFPPSSYLHLSFPLFYLYEILKPEYWNLHWKQKLSLIQVSVSVIRCHCIIAWPYKEKNKLFFSSKN